MNGKELKEEFKSEHGLSEMNENITNYSEWLEDKLIALTKAENLPTSDIRLSLPDKEKIEVYIREYCLSKGYTEREFMMMWTGADKLTEMIEGNMKPND